jgi:SAM-dependent methyltransferase
MVQRAPSQGLLSIDVGCGAKKRPGTLGVDALALPGVDHVVNLDEQPLPFEDSSVGAIFSSHCMEHVRDPLRLLREMFRVAAHGAKFELWVPYGWDSDAQLFDHKNYFNERHFDHVARLHPEFWREQLGAGLVVDEIVLALDDHVPEDMARAGVDIAFAIRYHINVVREIGVFATIHKAESKAPVSPFRTMYSINRLPETRKPLEPRRSLLKRARAAVEVLTGKRG